VAAAAGISQRTVSRYEAGSPPHPTLVQAARVARVVGLEMRVQLFPAASRLRDAAHVALIRRFLTRLHESIWRRLEAPVRPADQRAWDVLMEMRGVRVGVIAETRIRDLQELLRREHRKQIDGDVQRLILLVAGTKHNRRVLHEAGSLLTEAFPLGTKTILAALAKGQAPSANGIVIL
jgi:transcriptional regulator with XRE-family HTH domain